MTLVDTNVLLDIFGDDPQWFAWSVHQLDAARVRGPLFINDVIFAEASVRFPDLATLESALAEAGLILRPFSREALFRAGKAFLRYRTQGGSRARVLPDFFIGAQAVTENLPLLTRDKGRYESYFAGIQLISPGT